MAESKRQIEIKLFKEPLLGGKRFVSWLIKKNEQTYTSYPFIYNSDFKGNTKKIFDQFGIKWIWKNVKKAN